MSYTQINLFSAVCSLCNATGFRLNTRQINVLRSWIETGDYAASDRDMLADAVVQC